MTSSNTSAELRVLCASALSYALFHRRGAENSEKRGEETMHENEISERIIGAAIEVHRTLGPGLLEGIYEECLCHEFHLREIKFERQKPVPVEYKGKKISTNLRLDLLVEKKVIVDLKAKERMTDKDHAKTLSYLRLTNTRLGLNMNFHEPRLVDGIKRIVNDLK